MWKIALFLYFEWYISYINVRRTVDFRKNQGENNRVMVVYL